MDTFAESARKHFDFLIADYGFVQGAKQTLLPELSDSSYSVRYDAPHIFIWIHIDKNEVCVVLFVKVHTSILRPSGKRVFQLRDILRYSASDSLRPFPKSETPGSAPKNFGDFLQFYAEGLRLYCDPLLRMDLKQLEEISQKL